MCSTHSLTAIKIKHQSALISNANWVNPLLTSTTLVIIHTQSMVNAINLKFLLCEPTIDSTDDILYHINCNICKALHAHHIHDTHKFIFIIIPNICLFYFIIFHRKNRMFFQYFMYYGLFTSLYTPKTWAYT